MAIDVKSGGKANNPRRDRSNKMSLSPEQIEERRPKVKAKESGEGKSKNKVGKKTTQKTSD